MLQQKIKTIIRDIPDFPRKGILFKDITPILQHQNLCSEMLNKLVEYYKDKSLDALPTSMDI